MSGAVVGGNVRYPCLQQIADLFRNSINDTANSTTGAGIGTGNQAGLIMPNSSNRLLTFMNFAIRDLYSDLRNVGDPSLILDNYCLIGLPPLTGPDPTVQVSLAYAGYFDGFQWHPQWTLPISTSKVLRVWERWTGSNEDFRPMEQRNFGLPGTQQQQRNYIWEMRQNAIWMPGTLTQFDLRLRVRITFPDFLDPTNIDFSTAYVPIPDSTNAIVAKMLRRYAMSFAPEMYQMAVSDEKEYISKLQLEVVRQQQTTESERVPYGEAAVTDHNWNWQL